MGFFTRSTLKDLERRLDSERSSLAAEEQALEQAQNQVDRRRAAVAEVEAMVAALEKLEEG